MKDSSMRSHDQETVGPGHHLQLPCCDTQKFSSADQWHGVPHTVSAQISMKKPTVDPWCHKCVKPWPPRGRTDTGSQALLPTRCLRDTFCTVPW